MRRNKKIGDEVNDAVACDIFSENFFKFQGMSNEYSYLLDLKHELAKLQVDYLEGKGRYLLNFINAKQAQISEQEKKLSGGMSISQAKTFIEENMKAIIQLDTMTVEDFYTKLKHYGRKH